LQGSASEVGEALSLFVTIPAHVQHQPSDGIGGVEAVAQQVRETFVASNSLVLAKGNQQVGEWLLRDIQLADGLLQGHEHRVPR
jgi:hypothetical protein